MSVARSDSVTQKLAQWSQQSGRYEIVKETPVSTLSVEKLNPLRIRFSNAFGGVSSDGGSEGEEEFPKEGFRWKSVQHESYKENVTIILDQVGTEFDKCVENLVVDSFKKLPKLSPLAIRERPGLLSEAISLSSSLTSVDLPNMNLGDDVIARLSKGLSNHRSVCCINLEGNGLTEVVLDPLRTNLPAITVMLSLSNNLFTDCCSEKLRPLLLRLKKLRHLDLSANTIGRKVGKMMLEVFSSDMGSEFLVSDTQIPKHMISLLTSSKTISEADEYHSDPEPQKLARLSEAVESFPHHMTCMTCKSPNHYTADCPERPIRLPTQQQYDIGAVPSVSASSSVKNTQYRTSAVADCWDEL